MLETPRRWGRKGLGSALAGLLAATGVPACDEAEDGTDHPRECELAADTVRGCFGNDVAEDLLEGCDPRVAERLVDLSCDRLAVAMLDDKADNPVDEAIQRAIQEALYQAIVAGLKAALEQIGLPFGEFDAYILLDRTDSEDDANEMARQWAEDLVGHAGFDPAVRETSAGWVVVHAPCVVDLGEVLPEFVAELVLGRSDTISAMGGTVSHDGDDTDVHLPLTLLPLDDEDVQDPACP